MGEKKAVLLNSGGLDSFLAGKWLDINGYIIHSLYIHWTVRGSVYNPLAEKAALETSNRIHAVSHTVFPLEGDSLFGENNKLPHRPCCSSTMYYAIAGAYAYNNGCRYIASGHMYRDKVNNYEKEYFQAINTLFKAHYYGKNDKTIQARLAKRQDINGDQPFELLFPVFRVQNVEGFIAKLGIANDELKHTYSCTFYPPCKKCHKCIRRKHLGLE
jgi:7-cyano-7-deazaguanine synthase in queuosine biosynthesis